MEEIDLIRTGLNNVFTFIASDGSKRLVTKACIQGLMGEKTIKITDEEYRIWDPYHSKLASLILKGTQIPLNRDSTVLYLGAANGTTASYVSDIVSKGTVFAVEFSPRAMHDLIRASASRMNLIPIFADARHPGSYKNMVPEVDLIYQDIAQREQAAISIRNTELFLKKDGFLILIVKSRSINSSGNTDEINRIETDKIRGLFDIKELTYLKPFHSDHIAVIAQRLG